MKRTIRLTEDDLTRIVKKVINEQKNLDEAFIRSIFTSENDEMLENIFKIIKDNFNLDDLSLYPNGYMYEYRIFGGSAGVLRVVNAWLSLPPDSNMIVLLDGKEIRCSYIMARKIWNFFKSKSIIKPINKPKRIVKK
jgi:hypothetical protein